MWFVIFHVHQEVKLLCVYTNNKNGPIRLHFMVIQNLVVIVWLPHNNYYVTKFDFGVLCVFSIVY